MQLIHCTGTMDKDVGEHDRRSVGDQLCCGVGESGELVDVRARGRHFEDSGGRFTRLLGDVGGQREVSGTTLGHHRGEHPVDLCGSCAMLQHLLCHSHFR
ncbi:Uncharacterised protein [Mycobacteroides abscessus subsp. abscessus]|nr:Uncharacterised protein [Mycobacteroides abscessus subsp. abscessus]